MNIQKIWGYCSRNIKHKAINRSGINVIKEGCGIESILQLPKRNIPERAIYLGSDNKTYSMCDTKKRIFLGRMKAFENLNDYHTEEGIYTKSFYIEGLKAEIQGQKVGTDFINFSKKESFRQNCNGQISLLSANRHRPPHAFYRKLGFDSKCKERIALIDEAIKNNIELPSKHWVMKMFYPAIQN